MKNFIFIDTYYTLYIDMFGGDLSYRIVDRTSLTRRATHPAHSYENLDFVRTHICVRILTKSYNPSPKLHETRLRETQKSPSKQ